MKSSFEIRQCKNPECGLRYPLQENHPYGIRCPLCLGNTEVILIRETNLEAEKSEKSPLAITISVVLDNIRSGWNAGSILRSADGFGFYHAYFCGITPPPHQNSVKKTSLGAENSVAWSQHKNALKLLQELKIKDWKVIVLEEHERAISINNRRLDSDQKYILVVGNEVTGVDPGLIELADDILQIPMSGAKRSFNVANAFSIAAYALLQDRQ